MLQHSPAYILKDILPDDLIYVINSFLPRPSKKKKQVISPSMQKELTKIQTLLLRGKNAMYMRNLEDFCLD
jgi:hypothetical protein